jgi:hypothetical protein
MNDKEIRNYHRFGRVEGFGQGHAAAFAPGSLGAQTFAMVSAVIVEIDGLAAGEVSAHGDVHQGTDARAQARAALRDDLEAINRTARVMDDVPGIKDKFRLPRGNNDRELINAARAFLADATPLKAQFIAHELPADFLEDLQADIDAMDSAMRHQATGVGDHVAASAALDDAFSRGNEAVRKLDPIVRNKFANDPAVLAAWTSASHVERAPRRKASEPPTAQPSGQ